MIRAIARFLADARATSAVEFALLAGPLFLLLFGSVEIARAYWAQQALHEVAMAGVRCAGLPEAGCANAGTFNAAKAVTFVRDAASARGLELDAASVSIDRNATCTGLSGFSRVTLSHQFETPLPFIDHLTDGLMLTAEACFPNQGS